MAAEILASARLQVRLVDHMAAPARKFLLAGRGGLNLTHSETIDHFVLRYGKAADWLEPAIRAFSPQDLVKWCEGLGVPTFVGTSGRVFPATMKASPLLRAWLRRLSALGVSFEPRTPWTGFTGEPAVLAFGGASWPHLGSDAAWVPVFREAGIEVSPLRPANGRFLVDWSAMLRERFAGVPLKNVALTYGGRRVRGEIMITRDGIEGGAVYALSATMRDEPGQTLFIDLKPDTALKDVEARLARPRGKDSQSNYLRKALGLPPLAISLLREGGRGLDAEAVKAVPVKIKGPAGIARSISSAGGVMRHEVTDTFMLKKVPGTFVCGEMLDWEAPTGGYLLQGTFSTAVAAARGLLAHLGVSAPPAP